MNEYISIISKTLSSIDKCYANNILKAMGSYRGLSDEFYNFPDKTSKDILESECYSNIVYYPCNVTDLRIMLSGDLSSYSGISFFFFLECIKKYLQSYPLFIGYEINKKDFYIIGGLAIKTNVVDISKNIKQVLMREDISRTLTSKIGTIIEESGVEADTVQNPNIPSLYPKTAMSAVKKKFIVDLEALGIRQEHIVSRSPEDAVEEVLSRRWRSVGKGKPKPVRYMVKNWKDSPFWESIVRQAQSSKKNIDLNQLEENIFSFIKKACQWASINPEPRIAGGWVRDKLMGKESDDIDISLDGMTGKDFVEILRKYGETLNNNPVGKSYIVEQNIEKSKHLATAGLDLFGQKLEFVNLRSEEYGDSRVPTMKMGTPEEDAYRRDLTINSLFYNINTGQVEDLTGMGLKDLETLTLRTPLEPKKTFSDDPLRMLRVIRFHSRYLGSKIDPGAIEAMSDPSVQSEISKLSPERSSTEIIKMMYGDQPEAGLKVLFSTGLYKPVFQIPEQWSSIDMDQKNAYHKLNLMNHIIEMVAQMNKFSLENNIPNEERMMMNVAGMFHDFGKMNPEFQSQHPKDPTKMRYLGHEESSSDFAQESMTKMGFPANIKKFVIPIIQNHMIQFVGDEKKKKIQYGKFLREVGPLWESIMRMRKFDRRSKGEEDENILTQYDTENTETVESLRQYQESQKTPSGTYLYNSPLLNGQEIRNLVPIASPELETLLKEKTNQFISNNVTEGESWFYLKYISEQLIKQQQSGNVTTKEQAVEFVKGQLKQLLSFIKRPKMSSWWHTIKLSDASSDQGPEGYQGSEDGEPKIERIQEEKFVSYSVPSPFQKGDEIRERRGSIGDSNANRGRVIDIFDNRMKVEWTSGKRKGKVSSFSLLDAAKLYLTLEKIR